MADRGKRDVGNWTSDDGINRLRWNDTRGCDDASIFVRIK